MKVLKKAPKVRSPIRMLPIDRLTPTPDNLRRPITQASVESLAKSPLSQERRAHSRSKPGLPLGSACALDQCSLPPRPPR